MSHSDALALITGVSSLIGGIGAEYDKGKLDIIKSEKECPSCKLKKMFVVCTPDKKGAFLWWCGNCCTMIVYEDFYHWHLDILKKVIGDGK